MNYIMEKEIFSQSPIIRALENRYIKKGRVVFNLEAKFKKITIIASGSSYNAALLGKYFFESISETETSVVYASEFAHSKFLIYDENSLYIFISQSGKSADTLRSLRKVKQTRAKTFVITNNTNSPMYKEGDYKIDINAQMEFAIAATKTFSASVYVLWLISIALAQGKNLDIKEEIEESLGISYILDETLKNTKNIDKAAKFLAHLDGFPIAGFGANYALARECALKIKETSYLNTSSYPIGEFVHGHFALLNKTNSLVIFINQDCTLAEYELLNKIQKTYSPKTLVISDNENDFHYDILIKTKYTKSKIATVLNSTLVLQLLALKVAILLKRDVDKPQGLNKIVEKDN